MRHTFCWSFLLFSFLYLVGCSAVSNETPALPSPSAATGTASLTPTAPLPSATPTPSPTPTDTPAPTQTPTPDEPSFRVRFHPDWALFVGDQVSFEVIAPPGLELADSKVSLEVISPIQKDLGEGGFGPFGIGGRLQATFVWVWDTTGLEPGPYQVQFRVEPEEIEWEETFELRPKEAMVSPEPEAAWARAESGCCIIHYVTGTEGERDLAQLLEEAERQAALAEQRMGAEFEDPVEITILPRVLGHGGFAGGEISVSYLDRNYAGNEFSMVLHHEMVHILDGRLGGGARPSILVEGLAVYLSGGHYKPEPLMQRAAALLEIPAEQEGYDLGWYIPLRELADNFYPAQHEIGYIQAGALVQYMVKRWGWEAYSAFYRDIQPVENSTQSEMIEEALGRHFDLNFDQLEADFLDVLRQELVTANHIEDVRLTVVYYDTLRRYQRLLDPSAYFRTAWLLGSQEMRQRGIVADYLRRPMNPENIALELRMIEAMEYFWKNEYAEAQQVLDSVHADLDTVMVEEPAGELPLR